MSLIHDPIERIKFLRFAAVGAIGSVVDFGIFNLLATWLKVPAILASVVSFSLAVINNFIWNRYWTYPETRQVPIAKQLTQFAIVSIAGLGIRTPLFAVIEKPLISLAEKSIPNFLTPTIVGHNVSLAFVILVVLLWNYFVNRKWTFRKLIEQEDKHESSTEA
jgi:putative flippase GtrA